MFVSIALVVLCRLAINLTVQGVDLVRLHLISVMEPLIKVGKSLLKYKNNTYVFSCESWSSCRQGEWEAQRVLGD